MHEERRSETSLVSPNDLFNNHGPVALLKATGAMREAVNAIEAGGSKVFTFAPSADASRGVLVKEGFEKRTRLPGCSSMRISSNRPRRWTSEPVP